MLKGFASVRVACQAMATRFEILLHGGREASLRAAGEEALAEVGRLEGQLSLYRPASEIARVNALAARQPVRVSPNVFQLLQQAQRLHEETGGAFDIALGPLVHCWGFMGGPGRLPEPESLARARALAGMGHVELDGAAVSVRFDREGVMIDLGAIGKGYAIDCAMRLLREAGVASALLHGGTSTTYAIGTPPRAEAWQVAIRVGPGKQRRPRRRSLRRLCDCGTRLFRFRRAGENHLSRAGRPSGMSWTRVRAGRRPGRCWRRSRCLRRRKPMRCPPRCWWRAGREAGGSSG